MEKIKDREVTVLVRKNMREYGIEVNEERSVPCVIDGLKPVQRRILWAMHRLGLEKGTPIKAARTVGDTIGKYSPHGDSATYDAMVTLANHLVPTVLGKGNWGSKTGDKAAHYRYTNAKLSAYGAAFFDPYYMPVIDLVPNYDGKDQEPVILHAPLPNILLNGSSGIGVGLTTEIPAYTPKSVVALLKHAIQNGPATALDCYRMLDFATESNGKVFRKSQKAALRQLYTTGIGSIKFRSRIEWVAQKKAWHLTGVAPFRGVDNYVAKIWSVAEIDGVSNVEDRSKNYNIDFWIYSSGRNVEDVGRKIYDHLTSVMHYKCNVNERKFVNKTGLPEVEVTLHNMTVPQMVNRWLIWRRDLEIRATKYHIGEVVKALRRNEILLLAVKHRDYIISLIQSKYTDEQIKKGLRDTLKLQPSEVSIVFDLQWRKLRALEGAELEKQRSDLESTKKTYEDRTKRPEPWIIKHLDKMEALCSN